MAYQQKVVDQVKKLPLTNTGARLGRWMIYLDLPATKIATVTGATRQTVYNWLKGGVILAPYRPAVDRLIEVMSKCKTSEEAWRKICHEFNIKA
jgi:hypothetical protein